MMDHYEELGIERSASLAEIRQSYRRLVRLLHPDRCRDQDSRRLAELQTKRLNAILAVLTNPLERERYDRELSFATAAPALPPAPRKQLARAPAWLWPVASAAVVLTLVSLMVGPQHSEPAIPTPPQPVAPAMPVPKHPASLATRSAIRSPVRAERKPLARPQAAEAENPGFPDPTPSLPPLTAPRIPPEDPPEPAAIVRTGDPPVSGEPGLRDPPRQPPRSTLAGEWLFLPQPSSHNNGLYPPEYIELRVTEGSGSVHGKYRARYRIPDQAISPTVAFEFHGQAGENGARLPWIGPGGARGLVTLHLLTSGALEVTWVVNQMGSELGLISGTATLVRKLD